MTIRQATPTDILQIQQVRNAVMENRLSNPALVSDSDVEDYITNRGRGWVAEVDGAIVGFAIADLKDANIWALFIHPNYEGRGVGKQLHHTMLDWYFANTDQTVWLSTSPTTRAEGFYRRAGWREVGTHGKGEIKFEMTLADWSGATQNLHKAGE